MESFPSLCAKYKAAVVPGVKTFQELPDWLSSHLRLVEMPLAEFSAFFLGELRPGALHAVSNHRWKLQSGNFNFAAFRLPPCAENRPYYALPYGDDADGIYLVIEKKTGYLYTNHPRLHLDATVALGVSREDCDGETAYLHYYLSCLNGLEQSCC